MKNSFLHTSLLALAVLSTVGAQGVLAQGARYVFAKHYWKVEQANVPAEVYDSSKYRQSAVPKSPSYLGLTPEILGPLPQQGSELVARHQSVGPNFRQDFGKPIQQLQAGQPLSLASAPLQTKAPLTPQPVAWPTKLKVAAPAHPHVFDRRPRHSVHSSAVQGRLQTHKETAAPQTSNYTTGYVPGAPGQSGCVQESHSEVRGRILQH